MRPEANPNPEPSLPISALSRAMLWLLLGPDERREMLGDLTELYELRCRRQGQIAAQGWLRRQMASAPLRLLAERIRRTTLQPGRASQAEPEARFPEEPMRDLLRDLRHSLRSLARTPALTLTILLTVGLGIGATTVITGVIHSVLIQPLPYAQADQLVWFYTDAPPHRFRFSVADYLALEQQQTSFSQIAAYQSETRTFGQGDVVERLEGRSVTWGYFPLLGLHPLHGRLFAQADDAPGAQPTVVVSHSFWMRYLEGNPAAVGQTIRLDGQPYDVIGVLPQQTGPFEHGKDFFTAARFTPPTRKGPFYTTALGRLKPGVDRAAATAQLQAINRRLFPLWKASYQDEKATWRMLDLKERVVGDVGTTLLLVLAAVGFLLLITCANAANLLLARATQRSRELAVRSALGASRGWLLQHLLSESLVLAVGAAALGVLFTAFGLDAIRVAGAAYLPRAQEIGWDRWVLGSLASITGVSLLLFGLIPAVQGARGFVEAALRSGGRGTSDGVGSRRWQRGLVVLQFAVATPLLIGAGLLLGSLARMQRVEVGFDTNQVLTAGVQLPAGQYSEEGRAQQFWSQALERVQALPGVRSAALMDSRPPSEGNNVNNFELEDHPTPAGQSPPAVPWVTVSPQAFEVLGLKLLSGRLLEATDQGEAPPVVVVDQTWASRYFPGQDAVGRRFREGGCTDCPWTTVVGVVEDVRYSGLDQPPGGTIYSPVWPALNWLIRMNGTVYLVVRTEGAPSELVPALRQVVRELDPSLPLMGIATIDQLVQESLDNPRSLTVLVAAFATMALVLSLVGIYGVMSFFVQRHTKDIGIRLALGGRPAQIWGLVVQQGMRLVGLGLVLGLAAAWALTRLMSSLLFEVGATDPWTFAAVTVGLAATSLLACAVPGRRASIVDPARILHDD